MFYKHKNLRWIPCHPFEADLKLLPEEKRQWLARFLHESDLGRILQHVKSNIAIGIISAERSEYSKQGNLERTKNLLNKIRLAGFGYTLLNGSWEDQETKEVSREKSAFVVDRKNDPESFKRQLEGWRDEFDQQAVAFKPSDEETVYGLNADGTESEYGEFHVRNPSIHNVFSEFIKGNHRGKGFVFATESIQVKAYERAESYLVGHEVEQYLKNMKGDDHVF